MKQLILSHQIEALISELYHKIRNLPLLETKIILVPNESIKQFLSLKIAELSPCQVLSGQKILTLETAIRYLLPKELIISSSSEIFISIYNYLKINNHTDIDQKILNLTHHLTSLIFQYAEYGFNPKGNWQEDLISYLFKKKQLRLLFHHFKNPKINFHRSIHCFGFSFLSPFVWDFLASFSSCFVYLFSPCAHYWTDTHSEWEQKGLDQFWKKKGASLEQREALRGYLANTPPLLANLGKIGRETLKILDHYPWELIEHYPLELGTNSNLNRLKKRLLEFSLQTNEKYPEDDSVQITAVQGSSLEEIEALKQSIHTLVTKHEIKLSEILILAPRIQQYAGLIDFVFQEVPYRIDGLSLTQKSNLYQGWIDFCSASFSELTVTDLVNLIENPIFEASEEEKEKLREWSLSLKDPKEWQDELIEQWIFFHPQQKNIENTELIDTIKQDLLILKKEMHTLKEWGDLLTQLFKKYFKKYEEDQSFSFFTSLFEEFKASSFEESLSFAPVFELLKKSPPQQNLHSTHLHALRFASLQEGSLIPAKAIILIGMDEDRFPTKQKNSSLHCGSYYEPSSYEQDRYALLQTIFSAKEFLWISYQNFANEEGKSLELSFLIEDLIASLDAPVSRKELSTQKRVSFIQQANFQTKPEPLPSGSVTISMQELNSFARHPWRAYLKKEWGISLEEFEEIPFAIQKGQIVKQQVYGSFTLFNPLPRGLCKIALTQEIEDKTAAWKDQIASWKVDSLQSFHLHRSCVHPDLPIIPSFKFDLTDTLHVEIIGTIEGASLQGYIHRGDDSIEGLLKIWPECLSALIATNTHQIFCLKTGKIKAIENPEKAFRAFLLYYFQAKNGLSPLLPQWADAILRKDFADFSNTFFEDPTVSWIQDRISLPANEDWKQDWEPLIHSSFAELKSLYPTQRAKHAII